MALEFDRSIIGSEYDHTVHPPVAAERIREYAAAAGETNPRYTTADDAELIASPTFVVSLRGQHFWPRNMPNFGRSGFDAGKDIEFGAPVRAGDVLTSTSTVHDIYEKTGRSGSMVFIILRTLVTNQRGELVATIDQKMMVR
ncbi:MAG: MaoC family dehydratase N-terminal domain-containing protein [Deltaproteobacteria bacterium]|nr:MaoC family dehydratase N-terminal domain-containing protein [Deltaproteobacteria bacterium]